MFGRVVDVGFVIKDTAEAPEGEKVKTFASGMASSVVGWAVVGAASAAGVLLFPEIAFSGAVLGLLAYAGYIDLGGDAAVSDFVGKFFDDPNAESKVNLAIDLGIDITPGDNALVDNVINKANAFGSVSSSDFSTLVNQLTPTDLGSSIQSFQQRYQDQGGSVATQHTNVTPSQDGYFPMTMSMKMSSKANIRARPMVIFYINYKK